MGTVKLVNDIDGEFRSFSQFASARCLFCAQEQAHKHIAHQRIHIGAYSVMHIHKFNPLTRHCLSE